MVSQQEPRIPSNDAAHVILQQDSAPLGRQAAKLSLQGQVCQLLYKQIFKDELKPSWCLLEYCVEKKNQIFSESTRTACLHWPRKLIISISECRNGSNGSDRVNPLNFALLWIIGGDFQWQLPTGQTREKSNWEVAPSLLLDQCRNKGPYLDPQEKKFPGNINSRYMEYSDVVRLSNRYDASNRSKRKKKAGEYTPQSLLSTEVEVWVLSPTEQESGSITY